MFLAGTSNRRARLSFRAAGELDRLPRRLVERFVCRHENVGIDRATCHAVCGKSRTADQCMMDDVPPGESFND